jgi:hypothetical protein
MIKLSVDDLYVTTYAIDPGDGGVLPGDDTTTSPELKDTDPRACPWTQGWDCPTVAAGCETSPGYNC